MIESEKDQIPDPPKISIPEVETVISPEIEENVFTFFPDMVEHKGIWHFTEYGLRLRRKQSKWKQLTSTVPISNLPVVL